MPINKHHYNKTNTRALVMIALYDYDPQSLSPNVDADVELPFRTGEIITVYGEMDEDGFYIGELNGKRGLVPSNFLQPIEQENQLGVQNQDKYAVRSSDLSKVSFVLEAFFGDYYFKIICLILKK